MITITIGHARPTNFNNRRRLVFKTVPQIRDVTSRVFTVTRVLQFTNTKHTKRVVKPDHIRVASSNVRHNVSNLSYLVVIEKTPLSNRHRHTRTRTKGLVTNGYYHNHTLIHTIHDHFTRDDRLVPLTKRPR